MQPIFNATRAFDSASTAVVSSAIATLSVFILVVTLTVSSAASAETSGHIDAGTVVDSRPIVYLTFDDGPSADMVTDELLHVLAKYNATATFFVTGQRVRREQGKIAQIVYAGHAIGNHTHSHVKLTQVNNEAVLAELKAASEVILAAGGPPPTCFRPPFGSTNRRINQIASQLGLVPVGWTIDTRDWEKSTSIAAIGKALDRTARQSIVLLHDGPSYRGKTLRAFSDWMATEAHRFQFRALPECSSGDEGTVHLAQAELPPSVSVPAVVGTAVAVKKAQKPDDTQSVALEAVKTVPPVVLVHTSIPELLAKIRAYRFHLYEDGQPVDLTQVTATLNTEIHGDHFFRTF